MTFTYTPGGATDKDRIRVRTGDTDSSRAANQRLEDEEIADFLLTEGAFRAAALGCARALLAKLAALPVEKGVGDLDLVWERRDGLKAVIQELKAGQVALAVPYAGGISKSDKETVAGNSDRVEPPFKTGMLDNPRAS